MSRGLKAAAHDEGGGGGITVDLIGKGLHTSKGKHSVVVAE